MTHRNFTQYVSENVDILNKIDETQISDMTESFQEIRRHGRFLWIIGNGGAASTASHLVTDFSKGASESGGKPLRSVAITEMTALTTATANDLSFEDIFSNSLNLYASTGDAVLMLSVSGTSPNLVKAHEKAKELGLKTFAIVGERGIDLASKCDVAIVLKSNDYQAVENIHLMIGHWIMKQLRIECQE